MLNATVDYQYSDNIDEIADWLSNLPELCAYDFEAASKFTKKQKELLQIRYDLTTDYWVKRELLQKIHSNGLSHPSLVDITHLAIAWSNKDAYVIICPTDQIRKLVFNYLIRTNNTQIWHNTLYDFKLILYNTGRIPMNYVDSMLLTKAKLNNADSFKDKVGLKDLMGWKYGEWALDKENDEEKFVKENMYSPKMIKYAAIDACAGFSLYQELNNERSRLFTS